MKKIPLKFLILAAIAVSLLAGAVWVGIRGAGLHCPADRSRAHLTPISATEVNTSAWFLQGDFRGSLSYKICHPIIIFHPPTWDEAQKNRLRSPYRQRFWRKLTPVTAKPAILPPGFEVEPGSSPELPVDGTEREESAREEGVELAFASHRADAANEVRWPGGRLRLRAIAGAWPDALRRESVVPAVYYGAQDGHGLAAENFPETLRDMKPRQPLRLTLRLLFEIEGDLPFEHMEVVVFDARTRAPVAASFKWGALPFRRHVKDAPFLAVDLEAAVWHDTPLEVMVDLPTGPEQRHPFPGLGQPATFVSTDGRRIEVTRLATGRGEECFCEPRGGPHEVKFRWQMPDPKKGRPLGYVPKIRSQSVWDLGDLLESDYLRLRARFGNGEWYQNGLENIDDGFDHAGAELIFRPGRERYWFKVTELPMAPNARDLADLLDARIPGPVQELDYEWIAEAVQLTYDRTQSMDPFAVSLAAPRTDATLRELLLLCAEDRQERVAIDGEKLALSVRPMPPESRWQRGVRNWWNKRFP